MQLLPLKKRSAQAVGLLSLFFAVPLLASAVVLVLVGVVERDSFDLAFAAAGAILSYVVSGAWRLFRWGMSADGA